MFVTGISILYLIMLVFTAMFIFLENKDNNKTISWLLVLVFLPVLGFVLYLIFGENVRSDKNSRRAKLTSEFFEHSDLVGIEAFDDLVRTQKEGVRSLPIFRENDRRIISLILNSGKFPVTSNNKVRVFEEGVSKFESLLRDIEEAQHHIHIEYFIIKDSVIGNKLREALIRKAKQGVKIRIIYDDLGSWRLHIEQSYLKSLKESGCEVYSYAMEKFPFLYRNINFRDHRKIVIIDGRIGYIGGINIGDEYVHQDPYFDFWRDTHLRIEGEAVYSLQIVFLLSWYLIREEMIKEGFLFPPIVRQLGYSMVQIATSDASTPHETIYQAYFSGITGARRSIFIQTPYFIPDQALLTGLKAALLSGVEVSIMFPSYPDHFVVYHASHSYLEEVMELGAKVYLYKKGFLHSKVVIIDRTFATVGTANMDIRSFSLNAEINAFIYDDKSVDRLYNMFKRDIKDCVEVDYLRYRQKSVFKRFVEAFCRLFSPLL